MILNTETGCATIDVPETRPIDGYLTFQLIEFKAIDEDEVQITLNYLCHNMPWYKSKITDRIEREFAEIARENKMDPPVTKFRDSLGETLVVADNFPQIGIFFDNVLLRFNNICKEYKILLSEALLSARFTHEVDKEKAEFHFSPFLFEPSALIRFKADNGNLTFNIREDSSVLRKQTYTDTYAAFLVESDPADSLFRARKSQLHFSFSKPPDPWYSWASIKSFFGADDDDEPKQTAAPEKKTSNSSQKKPSKIREAWDSTNTALKWVAGVLVPILGLFGITKLWKKR